MCYFFLGDDIRQKLCLRMSSKWVNGAELSQAIYSFIHNSSESHRWYRLNREWQGCRAGPLPVRLPALSLCLSVRSGNFPFKTIMIWARRPDPNISHFMRSCISVFWQQKEFPDLTPKEGQYQRNRHVGQGWLEHPQWPTDQACGNPATAEKTPYKMCIPTPMSSFTHTQAHTSSKRKDQLQAKNKYTKDDP